MTLILPIRFIRKKEKEKFKNWSRSLFHENAWHIRCSRFLQLGIKNFYFVLRNNEKIMKAIATA
jgi:hypothetical protein